MTDKITFTLSVVSHGDADKITCLLNSIYQQEFAARSCIQLIITDNLKNDLPEHDTLDWGSLRILRNDRQLGFAQNHNNAFKYAEGEYFVILNPDLVFEKPLLERLCRSLDGHRADLIAPQIVDETGAVQDSYRSLPTPLELIRRRLPGYIFKPYLPDSGGIVYPDWIAGMFWLLRSDIYRQLGGMDEKFFLYLEDVDFCSRARLRRMKLMVDTNIKVRHDAQRSSRRNLYFLYHHIKSALRFFLSPVYLKIRNL